MTRPEDLKSAPSPILDLDFTSTVLYEAINEPNTVQWVLIRSLVQRGAHWAMEMKLNQTALGLNNNQILAYFRGFMLPLVCLQGTILMIKEDKASYLAFVETFQQQNGIFPADIVFILENIDSLVELLQANPLGDSLIKRIILTASAGSRVQGMPGAEYFVQGLKLCLDVYKAYMDYFVSIRHRFPKHISLLSINK